MNSKLLTEIEEESKYDNDNSRAEKRPIKDFSDVIENPTGKDSKKLNSKNGSFRNTINYEQNNLFERISAVIQGKNLNYQELTPGNVRSSEGSTKPAAQKGKRASVLNLKRTNSNIIQTDLMAMGFELQLINNILRYYEISSIELAIEYLTQTNGKWNHPFLYLDLEDEKADERLSQQDKSLSHSLFVKKHLPELKCLICGDIAYSHLNYSKSTNKNFTNIEQSLSNNVTMSVDLAKLGIANANGIYKKYDLDLKKSKSHNDIAQKPPKSYKLQQGSSIIIIIY